MLKKYMNFLLIGILVAIVILSQISVGNEQLVAGDEDVDITPFRCVTHFTVNGDEDVSITPF